MLDIDSANALVQRIAQVCTDFDLDVTCRNSLFDAVLSLAPEELSRVEGETRVVGDEAIDRSIRLGSTHPDSVSAVDGALLPLIALSEDPDPVKRYEDLGPIGSGGMGEVHRVRDRTLNRIGAMKIVRRELLNHPSVLARFVEEAQATAQLQHPGIVPVHELGRFPDGRAFFTMKEVRGATLKATIQEVHAASQGDRWETAPSGWSFRKLIDAFQKVCEAVAYAHSRGVVHRDLKPSNVMVGSFGEVLVLDWGLAKVRGQGTADGQGEPDVVVTERSRHEWLATRVGTVTGTPAYMSPEQARGDVEQLGPTSDVYSLGAILYEILSNRPPYVGPSAPAVLIQVLSGPPLPPGPHRGATSTDATLNDSILQDSYFETIPEAGSSLQGPPIPDELAAICMRAMARELEDRYPDAKALAREIDAWLDGAQRRERAHKVIDEAEALTPEVAALRDEAERLRVQAIQVLSTVKPYESIERKLPGWTLEDEARRLEREADLKETGFLQKLQGALTYVPDLARAHQELADYYCKQHVVAEANGDQRAAARLELLLRAHDRGQYAAYLKGDGAVSLVTDPPGAEVHLYRYVEHERRLVPEFVRRLGHTPLRAVSLPIGSYLLRIRAPGRVEVRYPVFIGRQEHWDGVAPGDNASFPVYLPRPEELGPDDCYVPPGWFWSGDPGTTESLPRRRLWMDGFVLRRFPITNGEYLEFLNDLVRTRRRRDALRAAPRERGSRRGRPGAVIFGRSDDGSFFLKPDAEGDEWLPNGPVIMIDWLGAEMYARWLAQQSGQKWRLPYELEWEKAARGVDGRLFPWGNVPDPTWACMHDSFSELQRPLPVIVDSYPIDESPYGVRGMAGNVRDWCFDAYRREGPTVVDGRVFPVKPTKIDLTTRLIVRGGCWYWHHSRIRIVLHQGVEAWHRDSIFGFRLARPLPG